MISELSDIYHLKFVMAERDVSFGFLLQPSTEKIHQIIARTALFVSERGGQSEIILRVKQGNNPTFGFLMPNHNLHPYFRYLVDHPELMVPTKDKPIPQQDDGESDMGQNQSCSVVGEGLSLLGSIYGSGEDEDGSVDAALDPRDAESAPSVEVADRTHSQPSSHILDKAGSNHLSSVSLVKEKVPLACSHASVAAVAASELYSKRKELDAKMSITIVPNKPITSSSSLLKDESLIMEPPSSVKYVIEKIVEFIVKNGKEFEAILIEQDQNSGRFPFLLPSHRYHLHYLKVLQWALECMWPKLVGHKHTLDLLTWTLLFTISQVHGICPIYIFIYFFNLLLYPVVYMTFLKTQDGENGDILKSNKVKL
ncbi:hypothetical protein AMTRI_Chr03g48420 [Amborella trichopoda]